MDGSHFIDTYRTTTIETFENIVMAIFCNNYGHPMTMETAGKASHFVLILIVDVIAYSHELIGGQMWAIFLFAVTYLVKT